MIAWKRKVSFEILENVFYLEFGYPNIFYMQNFLFVLGFLGCGFWLMLSGTLSFEPMQPGEVNYFVLSIGYLIVFTLISRFQRGISVKKLLTVVNFVLGFMAMSTWLGYDVVSTDSAIMSLFYIVASLWGYALIDYLTYSQTSYSSVLLMATPLAFFGLPLIILRDPMIFMLLLILFVLIIGLLQFLAGRILESLVKLLPKFPFVVPTSKKRSFFDIMNIFKMYFHWESSGLRKSNKVLFLEHLFWFSFSPVVLLPLVSLLDLKEAQERDAKNKILQHTRQSPVRGMITPEDAARITKTRKVLVTSYLSDLARENSWKRYSGNIILFVDPSIVREEDLRALEFSERLAEIDSSWMPSDLSKVLHAICFSYNADSVEKIARLLEMQKEHVNNAILTLEKRGIVKILIPDTSEATLNGRSLERILEKARIEYGDTLLRSHRLIKSQVLSRIQEKGLPPLSKRIEEMFVDMIFKTILSCSRLYQKEFQEISRKADELGRIGGLVYDFPLERQIRAIESLFNYVRDEVPTQGEMTVKYPWITVKEGGLCTSLTVLLASMLKHLGFFVGIALIAPKNLPAHSFVTVLLRQNDKQQWLDLDPSHYECDINKIHPHYQPYRKSCYEIRLHEIDETDFIKSL